MPTHFVSPSNCTSRLEIIIDGCCRSDERALTGVTIEKIETTNLSFLEDDLYVQVVQFALSQIEHGLRDAHVLQRIIFIHREPVDMLDHLGL